MTQPAIDQSRIVIRDGVETDIPFCRELRSDYQTEHVWQMTVQELTDQVQISYRRQRLPRPLVASHETDPRHLEMAIRRRHCFVVVQDRDSHRILAFISMRVDETSEIAYLQDIVVDRPYRRQSLGSRLVNVARVWARENELRQIMFEIATTNYPCIQFAQDQGFVFCGFNDRHLPSREIAVFFSVSV